MNTKHDIRRCLPDQACSVCGRRSSLISAALGLCRDCIRASSDKAIGIASARHGEARKAFDLPLVIASTLLVPGYVDAREVGLIAGFIASLNPNIPYALLALAPQFYMQDLPRTSVGHAEAAEEAARAAGLTNVRIGNRHLLSRDY